MQKCFSSIVLKKPSSQSAAYHDDEKYILYGLFDGLNFLFGLADFKVLSAILNEEFY